MSMAEIHGSSLRYQTSDTRGYKFRSREGTSNFYAARQINIDPLVDLLILVSLFNKSLIRLFRVSVALSAVVAGACLPAAALAKPAPATALAPSAKEYVPLAEWAGAHEFQIHWLRRDESVEVTNHQDRLIFEVDSCQARVNGVEVWLLHPVAKHNGALYVTRQDLETTLRPLLWPAKSAPGSTLKTICLDPGHGGTDSGFRVGSSQEKIFTLLLAQELKHQLTQAGFKVFLTRSRDVLIDLPERPEIARRQKADLFISLHFNSTPTSKETVKGSEVYCLTPAGANSTNSGGEPGDTSWCVGNRWNDKNLLLAYEIQRSLVHRLGADDRGVRRARFAVLRDAAMPAILIEGGFLSHPIEGRRIIESEYRAKMARAIVDGVVTYKKALRRAD